MLYRLEYTHAEERSLIYSGSFEENLAMEPGDYMLVHHECRYCERPLVKEIIDRKVAYYFEDRPVYDYYVKGRSCYKSTRKLVSIYDQIVGECKMK